MALRPACLINIRYCMQHGGVSSKRPLLMNAVVDGESAQERYGRLHTVRYIPHDILCIYLADATIPEETCSRSSRMAPPGLG